MSAGGELTSLLRSGGTPSRAERLRLVLSLSWPAVMAQLSTILMEYIDASMVGSLGASASASIGLVATTSWLFWGLGGALSTGFTVQVAHRVGAGNDRSARDVMQQSFIALFSLGAILGIIGTCISGSLPHWLGGDEAICGRSSAYFMTLMMAMPFCYLTYLSSGMLRCSGNMIVPGLLNVGMCVMDIIFNWFLIFDSHRILGVNIPCAGLGVTGAAIGTSAAEIVTGCILMAYLVRRSDHLNLRGHRWRWYLGKETLLRAVKISAPIGAERVMMCGAQIATTVIVAPLGTAAIAANAFGITAESLCYMPGYGTSDAATTLVGQSLGAGRRDLARSFGKMSIAIGVAIMTFMGVVMWLAAPLMMSMFTPDETVRALGTGALRIEAWAEPLYAASIVCYGVMVGAGYTLVPACVNLGSIWIVRITLAALLAPHMGLNGVWLAMCIELCVRGIAFLAMFVRGRWLKHPVKLEEPEHEELDNQNEQQPYVL